MIEELRKAMDEAGQQAEDVQRRIADLVKLALEEREWDVLVSTPESQAYLARLSAEIDGRIAAGEVEDGGWDTDQ